MIEWCGNSLCEKGFIINLKEREDRLHRATQEINKAKIKGVERFEAVKIIEHPYTKFGCTQSHIDIAKLQIENNWDNVIVFEDDVVLDVFYTFESEEKILNYEKIVKTIIHDFKVHKPDVLWLGVQIKNSCEKISDVLIKPSRTLMSHAYISSLKYAKFLVKNLRYNNRGYFSYDYAIDTFMTQIIEKNCWHITETVLDGREEIINNDLKILATVPMIFNQGESYSNLTETFADYYNLNRGYFNYFIKELNIKPIYE